jgi:hypothetical protein
VTEVTVVGTAVLDGPFVDEWDDRWFTSLDVGPHGRISVTVLQGPVTVAVEGPAHV